MLSSTRIGTHGRRIGWTQGGPQVQGGPSSDESDNEDEKDQKKYEDERRQRVERERAHDKAEEDKVAAAEEQAQPLETGTTQSDAHGGAEGSGASVHSQATDAGSGANAAHTQAPVAASHGWWGGQLPHPSGWGGRGVANAQNQQRQTEPHREGAWFDSWGPLCLPCVRSPSL